MSRLERDLGLRERERAVMRTRTDETLAASDMDAIDVEITAGWARNVESAARYVGGLRATYVADIADRYGDYREGEIADDYPREVMELAYARHNGTVSEGDLEYLADVMGTVAVVLHGIAWETLNLDDEFFDAHTWGPTSELSPVLADAIEIATGATVFAPRGAGNGDPYVYLLRDSEIGGYEIAEINPTGEYPYTRED